MDTTDSSMSSTTTGSPPRGSMPMAMTMSTPPSSHCSSSTSQNLSHSAPGVVVSRSRLSLERRSSNPGESIGLGHHHPNAATVLMMRRRLSSSSNWTTSDIPTPTPANNNNNSSNNNNNYNNQGLANQGGSQLPPGSATTIRKEREQRLFPNHPVSTLMDDSQMNLKRSSSAPMINQLGIPKEGQGQGDQGNLSGMVGISSTNSSSGNSSSSGGATENSSNSNRETSMDIDVASFTTSYLASLNNPRPRRYSSSFCPGSPGPAPNRVSQLRHENATDWEASGEKEFLGTVSMAQSWEDLSLDPMEIGSRRPSISDTLWLSMPPGSSSASSSPAVSPRVLSRFSPSLSSPSPTRKSFTTRRSLSPIAVRPSVLSIPLGQGVKRKCDWDSGSSSSNQMETTSSPQPAPKRIGGLLSLGGHSRRSSNNGSPTPTYIMTTGAGAPTLQLQPQPQHPFQLQQTFLAQRGSPNSLETTGTESSVSSVSGGGDSPSPFFRPVDSPMNSPGDQRI